MKYTRLIEERTAWQLAVLALLQWVGRVRRRASSMQARMYLCWLQILRYANWIDLVGAQRSGNLEEVAWTRIRIAELDQQIDRLSIAVR